MKNSFFIIGLILGIQIIPAQNQELKISNKLKVVKLSDNSFMHTSENNNGLIYCINRKAIIVSTPMSDDLTLQLINWTKGYLKADIVGYIIDMWHPDGMGGLGVVKGQGIRSYAYKETIEIAQNKGLPVPEIGFDSIHEISVGNKKAICHFLGEAHTSDGIVVWLPDEKILFGGNKIRNLNSGIGNIGNANLEEWSNTVLRIKKHYGNAKIVIPGHGNFGGVELLDYTIQLYKPDKWGKILRKHDIERLPVFNDFNEVFVVAKQDSVDNDANYLKEAIVFVDDHDRYLVIESPFIEHQTEKKVLRSQYGRLKIYNKLNSVNSPTTDVYYNRLTVIIKEDEPGIVIILHEII